jgi:hypothetical protein
VASSSSSSRPSESTQQWQQAPGVGRRLESLSLPRNALSGPLLPNLLKALPVGGGWLSTFDPSCSMSTLSHTLTQHSARVDWTAEPLYC